VTVAQVQREFAEFLRLKPGGPALAHLQQALHFASEISASKDANAAQAVETLVARYIRMVSDETFSTLERVRPGGRNAKDQFQFFGGALRLFHEYGYREDKSWPFSRSP
jgi:hypothetical protein